MAGHHCADVVRGAVPAIKVKADADKPAVITDKLAEP